jgi:hypothetical protein
MALYVAFDLLDLDGSEPADSLPGNVMAAATETERVVPQDVLIPEILGPFSHSPVDPSQKSPSSPLACAWQLAVRGSRASA